jgi:Mg-chelatase subunit ChlD
MTRFPPPPPRSRYTPSPFMPEEADDSRSKQLLIGTVVGLLIILLILFLLWLLFAPGGGGAGAGSGPGSGSGNSSGDGSGNEQGSKSPGTGDDRGGAGAPASTAKQGTAATGTAKPRTKPPEYSVAIQPVAPVDETAESDTGTDSTASVDERLGGGGGGGGGADGSEFFGVKSKGRRIAFVVDCSGSMAGPSFQEACAELQKSVRGLNSRQSLYVYFFDDFAHPMFAPNAAEPSMLRATTANVKRISEWVDGFRVGGGTNPESALLAALEMNADVIYLLTDGGFDPAVVDVVRQQNSKKATIHTIGFKNPGGEPLLKLIAEQNRGMYRYVP